MKCRKVWSGRLKFMAVALALAVPATLKAGPPLLCHSLNIGNAKSLPWSGGENWRDGDGNYDLGHLAADTLALLDPQRPVIVRMETLRRATIYAQRDPAVAKQLLVRLHDRAFASDASGRPSALAWFDYGYLVECYKQTGRMPGSHGSSPSSEIAASLDGYAAVEKAIRLHGDDGEMEFAAALIGLEGRRPGQHQHAERAVAGAVRDPLLAENLTTHFLGDGTDTMSATLTKAVTAKN